MLNQIKIFLSIAVFVTIGLTSNAQTIFTYGNSSTSTQEFLRAYNKNKSGTTDKEKSIREYLELYSNFKLKVKSALELRLDTLDQIKFEIKNFRDQIIDNYLIDTKSMQKLIDEAAQRSKKDIHTVYYFIQNTDSVKSLALAKKFHASLKAKEKFFPESPSEIIKDADVGFVTVFSTRYEFENAIYNTPIDNVSEIVKTSKGYYIFYPIETRQAIGKWNVAQILFLYPPSADATAKNKIKQKADSVYNLLSKGLSFEEAAKQFSEDRATAQSGGVLAEFGAGKYTTVFEENIIALKKESEISKPFETNYGLHIVKRISNKTIPQNVSDYTYAAELKQQILQDARIENERIAFAKTTALVTGLKKNILTDKELFLPIDSLSKNAAASVEKLAIGKKVLGSFKDGSKINGAEWISFLKSFYANAEHPILSNKQLLDEFFNKKIVEKYKADLENYNEEFKYQMQEFKEGNMLFEVMERNVWGKSSTDSAALSSYYQANKQKYLWEESADIVTFNCTSETVAKNLLKEINSGNNLASLIQKSNNAIQTDSARYELSQISGIDTKIKPAINSFSKIITNTDGTASIVQFLKYYPSKVIRTFAEARGLVINDYQTLLEKNWVDSLRKRYQVKYNEAVIANIVK